MPSYLQFRRITLCIAQRKDSRGIRLEAEARKLIRRILQKSKKDDRDLNEASRNKVGRR